MRHTQQKRRSPKSVHSRLKLSHHRHTGKRLAHRHTSWGVLVLMMIATTTIVGFATRVALAGTITSSGNITVGARIPGPPPSTPATIEAPINGQDFTSSKVTVSGTCPNETIVQIYKNGILAGAIDCTDSAFTLEIDLLRGKNDLVAKVIDNLDQYGPDSATVTVTYTPLALPVVAADQAPVTEVQKKAYVQALHLPQLLITTEATYQGVLAGSPLQLKLFISGGQAPYAISVDWGDGQQELLPRNEAGSFVMGHTYKQAGHYKVKVKAADALQSQSYLQTVAIVYGETQVPVSATTFVSDYADTLFFVWPMYLLIFTAVLFFWIGERRELYKLKKPVHKLKLKV
jgi:hypothetical protein